MQHDEVVVVDQDPTTTDVDVAVAAIVVVVVPVEEVVFIFNLEYMLPLYQERYHIDCQQSLNAHIA
jgi:riboflavin transporter FmnP